MTPPSEARARAQGTPWLWVLVALTLALLALNMVLARIAHTGHGSAIAAVPIAALGVLISRRARGNPIGWLLVGFAAWFAFYFDVGQYAVLAIRVHHDHLPFGRAAVDISSELWTLVFLILPVVILLFPDGKLPPVWRRVLWTYVAAVTATVSLLLWAGAQQVSVAHLHITGHGQLVDNPGTTGALVVPSVVCLVAILVLWVCFVARQVLAWRQAGSERRQQLKWLVTGSVLSLVGLVAAVVLAQFTGHAGVADVGAVCLAVGLFSLPTALTIGILRFRLYDIDRVISRTVSYALLTGAIFVLYAAVITLATRAFGFSSSVAVAASTLGAAAMFNPLRRRLQAMVDRRFNRSRYDAQATVAAFADGIRTEVDLSAASRHLLAAVAATLEPSSVSLWLPRGERAQGGALRGGPPGVAVPELISENLGAATALPM